jgi:hypothetical protein
LLDTSDDFQETPPKLVSSLREHDRCLATPDYFTDAIITNTSKNRQISNHTKDFLPKYPTALIPHPLEEEF